VEQGGFSGISLYQSESEEDERPRIASQLPIDLKSYKFLGAEPKGEEIADGVIFSGPVQFDEKESENYILIPVEKDNSIVRVYVERAGTTLTLEEVDGNHGKNTGVPSNQAIHKQL